MAQKSCEISNTNNEVRDYLNTSLPIEQRVKDLVSRMTLAEKITQMLHQSAAIDRLDIPEYNWWNECLHGVARAGVATVFPQAIGLAATFNDELVNKMACATSDEARAKYNEFSKHNDRGIYKGLTYWSPNINIFRDPRWGRGHETYGEDPVLTAKMGVAFIKGLQGDHPRYRKLDATAKHYAVHSGPENERHGFDAVVSRKDLRETYLYAFRECVKEANVAAIMGAYNRTNGEPCCASKTLLQDILRDEWGFDGYVVSDCGAICDIHNHHKVTETPAESAALAVNNGCDLNCGSTYQYLLTAVASGLISEDEIDKAVTRLYTARFHLGMFDPEDMVPYSTIPYEVVGCEEHRKLTLQTARESMVLLKNKDNTLPLDKGLKTIAVVGPNAYEKDVLLGNYNGTPSKCITPLDGIRSMVSPETKVIYAKGCELTSDSTHGITEAVIAAEKSDAVIMVLGLSPTIEGEEGDAYNSEAGGDKPHLDLPGAQQKLLEAVCAAGKPVVLVLISGSALAVKWADEHVPAIIQAWYPGEEGGNAIADVIFGNYNPAGRLPVTFVKSMQELPPFGDYNMKNRTYRYMEEEGLYPFGFGLSYTTFKYGTIVMNKDILAPGEDLEISVEVENIGEAAGDEVVQVYLSDLEASVDVPVHKLVDFKKVTLVPGERKTVAFRIKERDMALINNDGKCMLEPGKFKVYVGGSQPDSRSRKLTGNEVKSVSFEVEGEVREIFD